MDYKFVPVSDSASVAVPLGLSPDEEATFIAGRLAFVDLEALEAQCTEAMRLSDEGKTVSLQSVLDELQAEVDSDAGTHP